jgi:hypothetical protein
MRTIKSRKTKAAAAAGTVAALTLAGRAAGYRFGLNTPVRCRDGHLFTTIWIPGVNLKALDFGFGRVQHCPVGHHWTVVRPVRDADLSPRDRIRAAAHRDIPLP